MPGPMLAVLSSDTYASETEEVVGMFVADRTLTDGLTCLC
jgi:hypothetical protein